jgi:hypothetical protein
MFIDFNRQGRPALCSGYVPDAPLRWLQRLRGVHEQAVADYERAEADLVDLEASMAAEQAAYRTALASAGTELPKGPDPAHERAQRDVAQSRVCVAAFGLARVAETALDKLITYLPDLKAHHDQVCTDAKGTYSTGEATLRLPYVRQLGARLGEAKQAKFDREGAVRSFERFRDQAKGLCPLPEMLVVSPEVEQAVAAIDFPDRSPVWRPQDDLPSRPRPGFDEAVAIPGHTGGPPVLVRPGTPDDQMPVANQVRAVEEQVQADLRVLGIPVEGA